MITDCVITASAMLQTTQQPVQRVAATKLAWQPEQALIADGRQDMQPQTLR